MKFSIVTPTYNSLDHLKRCVGSLRAQKSVDYQHIIQDGASNDGTPEWLSAQSDLEAYVEEDRGMYDAINKGWSRASGDILAWLNSDEQYLPGTLARVAEAFQRHPEIDFIQGHFIVVDGDGAPIAARREIRPSRLYIANTFLNAASCTLFFRRAMWEEGLLRLDTRYRYAADMDMVLRVIQAGKRCLCVKEYLSLFTFDGSNLSCHQEMLDETAQIQREHGAFRLGIVRNAVRVFRNIERLVKGSYRTSAVSYDYALDEIPTYRSIAANAIPFFYKTRE